MNLAEITLKIYRFIKSVKPRIFRSARPIASLVIQFESFLKNTERINRVDITTAFTHSDWDGANIKVVDSSNVLVQTGSIRWSYAASIPIKVIKSSGNSTLSIQVKALVHNGAIGIGLLCNGSSELISEIQFLKGDGLITKSLEIIPFDGSATIIVRNISDSGEPSIINLNCINLVYKNFLLVENNKKYEITNALSDNLLKKLEANNIFQLFVTSRSGSMAVHAYLDGHPEIIMLPQIFKYYDYYLRYVLNGSKEKSSFEYAIEFISVYPELFGEKLTVEVPFLTLIDKVEFVEAFSRSVSVLGKGGRQIFISLHIAYAWCLGIDLNHIKVFIQHLHHGDWLFPRYLINYYNIGKSKIEENLHDILNGSYIVMVRNPLTATSSFFATAHKAYKDPAQALEYFDDLLELMIQDWLRTSIISQSNTKHFIIKLEDLKKSTNTAINDLTEWLGVDHSINSLDRMTVLGREWGGDSYSPKSNSLRPEPAYIDVSYATRQYIYALIGDLLTPFGYGDRKYGCGLDFLRIATKLYEIEGLSQARLERRIKFGEDFLLLKDRI